MRIVRWAVRQNSTDAQIEKLYKRLATTEDEDYESEKELQHVSKCIISDKKINRV